MGMPRFTAESSLYPQLHQYSTGARIERTGNENIRPQDFPSAFEVSWNVHCTEAGLVTLSTSLGTSIGLRTSNSSLEGVSQWFVEVMGSFDIGGL